jgi:hypothetical protein
LRRVVEREHEHGSDEREPQDANEDSRESLENDLGSADSVRERELEAARFLIASNRGGRPRGRSNDEERESHESEQCRLGVAGSARNVVVPDRPNQL